ncbi:MAG: hypothetical protein ACD_79C00643G0002 [uncultured bacterium]|nr:MAG: hypothetical protein ACD_79C00643G0002 [uncultured bacterium]
MLSNYNFKNYFYSDSKKIVYLFIILFISVFILYLKSINYDFVWDDFDFLESNDKLTLNNIPVFFHNNLTFSHSPEAKIYRPFRNIIWTIILKFCGQEAFYFHFLNICIHSINTCLLFYLLISFIRTPISLSFILALFFGIHPINTEVVCWIKSLDDLFALFWGVLAITFAFKYIHTGFNRFILPVIIFYFLALLSKENALSLNFILILLISLPSLFLPENNSSKVNLKSNLLFSVFLILTSGIYLIMRTKALGTLGQADFPGENILKTQLGMSVIYLKYLHLLIFPVFQRVNYMSYNPFTYGYLVLSLIWLLLFIVSFFLVRNKTTRGYFICFIASLLPFSNIIPMMQWCAERFLYFPLVLFIFFAAKLFNSFSIKYIFIRYFILLYILILILLCNSRIEIWKNNQTLGYSMLHSNPYSYHGLMLAMEYNKKNNLDSENIIYGEKFIKLFPDEEFIYHYLVYAYLKTNDYKNAQIIIDNALTKFPDSKLLINFKTYLERVN